LVLGFNSRMGNKFKDEDDDDEDSKRRRFSF
jgi:hypothetical protein